MQRHLAVLAAAASLFVAARASAQITEPNGLVVPQDSMNGEEQLYTFFSSRGEGIGWIADAHATPAVFSPLCSFRATLVLQQTASSLGVGWYNVVPGATTPPTLADIHVVVPAGTPVGSVVSSATIRGDAAYAGGLIGFALVGWQTHYTEAMWNPTCTGCSPPGPWVMSLIYASTLTPNAYYVAFEDGPVGANPGDYGNDGDYNDYVFFFEGITCSGGGTACDTGMAGVCANGVEQCTPTGTMCTAVVTPSAESCNGLDDDCNGMTDEGTLCPTDFVCDGGTCVHHCDGGEFACTGGLVCSARGFCVDPMCATVDCPAGTVCHHGTCRAPCDGVTCPGTMVCRVDRCVDPCAGVTCGMGEVCDAGVCRDACSCAPCASGLACETSSGLCRDPACVDHSCAAGTHCVAGACVDDCTGATCPPGSTCSAGACVPDPCASMTCAPGMVCRMGACVDPCAGVTCGAGMACVGGTCTPDPCASVACAAGAHCVAGDCVSDDGGGVVDGGRRDGGGGHGVTGGGCCATSGTRDGAGAIFAALGALALVASRRRRR